MAEADPKKNAGDTIRISVAATQFLAEGFGALQRAILDPDPTDRTDAVAALGTAAEMLRASLKLVGALYDKKGLKMWRMQLRDVESDLVPLRDTERVIAALRSLKLADTSAGARATAFLLGHNLLLSDLQTAYALDRLECFDVVRQEKPFAKFAMAPRRDASSKMTLLVFSVGALKERVGVLDAWSEAARTVDDTDVWEKLQGAARSTLVALDLARPCYEPAAFEAARASVATLFGAASAVLDLDDVVDNVTDPDVAGLGASVNLPKAAFDEVNLALLSAEKAAVAAARRLIGVKAVADRRAAVLAPIAPDAVPPKPAPAPRRAPAATAAPAATPAAAAAPRPAARTAAKPAAPKAAPAPKPAAVAAPKPAVTRKPAAPKAAPAAKPAAPKAVPAAKPAAPKAAPAAKPAAPKAAPAAKPTAAAAPKPAAPRTAAAPKAAPASKPAAPKAAPAPKPAAKPTPAPKPATRARRATTPKPPATDA